MAKRVTAIPATLNRYSQEPVNSNKKRRVAGYGRVSTDSEEQATSYEAQVDYYTKYIQSRDDWEFVGMYTDEGITATNTKRRDGFKEMVEDALGGKIDLIITKSISRFARNTVDSLVTVRKLKEKGVEIYFEKENIWTLDSKGELLITIMSSLAQEESRSISENTIWGKRKAFSDGKASVAFKNFLGYDMGPNGEFVINLEQAKVVKLIYKLFLEGYSAYKIALTLTELEIPTPMRKKKWQQTTVMSILSNEKYKGDALLQKHYTEDFLTKKQKKNNGEIPQYYVEGHHEAIITKDTYEAVQAEIEKRKSMGRYSGVGIFSSMIKCGECGGWYGSKVWHSNDKYRRVVYHCNHKFRGEHKCKTPHITEEEIKRAFVIATNEVLSEKAELIENTKIMIETVCDVEELVKEQSAIFEEMNIVADVAQQLVHQNARLAMNQSDYQHKYDKIVAQYESIKEVYDKVTNQISSKQVQKQKYKNYISTLKNTENYCNEFNEGLWSSLVDYVTIYNKKDIRIFFKNGIELKVNITESYD